MQGGETGSGLPHWGAGTGSHPLRGGETGLPITFLTGNYTPLLPWVSLKNDTHNPTVIGTQSDALLLRHGRSGQIDPMMNPHQVEGITHPGGDRVINPPKPGIKPTAGQRSPTCDTERHRGSSRLTADQLGRGFALPRTYCAGECGEIRWCQEAFCSQVKERGSESSPSLDPIRIAEFSNSQAD